MPRTLGPILALLLLTTACPAGGTQQPPDDSGASGVAADSGGSKDDGTKWGNVDDVRVADPKEPGRVGPTLPTGPICNADADCSDGQICEGIGCEPGQGRCVDGGRMCTRDLATYCGCDGKDFQSSGSCPGRRFAYSGPCEPKLAVGSPCSDGRQCATGMCLGEGLEGCDRGAMGVCADASCTADLVSYCGCNGFEFQTSGSCPNRQFAYRGPCEDAAK
ncbi:MAG: hypothetical protein KC457_16240 [Myxococcales bacterium]|nr:hypothetical protein [Myxococcales bacterium]